MNIAFNKIFGTLAVAPAAIERGASIAGIGAHGLVMLALKLPESTAPMVTIYFK
jgi:hypothetical protein